VLELAPTKYSCNRGGRFWSQKGRSGIEQTPGLSRKKGVIKTTRGVVTAKIPVAA